VQGGGLPAILCRDAENAGRVGRGVGAPLPPGFLGGVRSGGGGRELAEDGYSIPYRWILLGLGVAGLLVLVVTPIAKWVWRRRALRRSRPPRELVLAAYRVFDGRAADLGLGRREGETLHEHRARLAAAAAVSDGHLGRLVQAAGRAAYSDRPPTTEQAAQAIRDARTAIADLRRDAGPARRLIGMYRPGL
jgi:hypothetical protein